MEYNFLQIAVSQLVTLTKVADTLLDIFLIFFKITVKYFPLLKS